MAAEETDKATAQPTAKSGSGESIFAESSKPAFANDSTRFFDFFGLPRELRDKIYEQPVLFEYEHLPVSSREDLITKAKKLRTSLLSVSRQFRDEYTERCAEQQVLCMRDHCVTNGDKAVLPPSNRAHFWAIEFFIMSDNTLDDLRMFKAFLDLQAGPNLTVRSISIKLLFEGKIREEIETGSVRRAISDFLACGKVASMKIYLAEKLWDYKGSGKPKFLIARWDRSDDTNIKFLTPAMEIYDMGSEWGHPSDTDPDCCDPSPWFPENSDSEDGGEDQRDSDTDGNEDDEDEHGGSETKGGNTEHGDEEIMSTEGNYNENSSP